MGLKNEKEKKKKKKKNVALYNARLSYEAWGRDLVFGESCMDGWMD